MDEDQKKRIWLEILTTLLVMLLYWISTQPDWKLEMYLRWLTDKLPKPVQSAGQKLSQSQQETLRRFRQEISNFNWENE